MLDDMMDVLGTEILQDGDDDRAVGDGGDIGDGPTGAVLPDEGDTVVLLDAALLKQQMQLLDLLGHLTVGEREFCLIICEGFQVPIATERIFEQTHKVFFYHCLGFKLMFYRFNI